MQNKLQILEEKKRLAFLAGGEDKLNKQRQNGRYTARERLDLLFDPGSFQEMDRLVTHTCNDFGMAQKKILGDGVITGTGLIQGRRVFAFSQDFTVFGGSLSLANAGKICKIMDMAASVGAPLLGLNDSGGARIQEGVESLGGYAEIFYRNTRLSGVVPQISLIFGPCAGGAVYSPAITDFISMVDQTSYMFVTGPEVIKEVTNEIVDLQSLGGATIHNETSGVAHFINQTEADALAQVKNLLQFLPQNNKTLPPKASNKDSGPRATPEILRIIPENSGKPYEMANVLRSVVDDGLILQVQELYACNIITAFAHIGNQAVGLIANNPAVLAGVLDINSSIKAARFVRFCDAFNIPLVTFVDVPGFLPGVQQEYGGIIKNGAKLLYAYCEATVPKITVITRKAYGGAYDVMSSKHIRSDFNFAYPGAEIAVMGARGAVNILYKDKIRENPELRQKYIEDYEEQFANPYIAAGKGYIDEVIHPADTRNQLLMALDVLKSKSRDLPSRIHGNIPL